MGKKARVRHLLQKLEEVSKQLPDKRKGHHNQKYKMRDAVLGAFAVFFTQSASFLAHQRDMKRRKGKSNMSSVFGAKQIPSDTQIRNMLDGAPAHHFDACYQWLWDELERSGQLAGDQTLGGRLLVGLDGIQFFSSAKIMCDQCRRRVIKGVTHYDHQAVTALVVHPKKHEVLALPPEFILPQDGGEKQDCETAASKRWLEKKEAWLRNHKAVLLGDDLYSRQPFCQNVLDKGLDFIFVCKPTSHITLYQWLAGMEKGGKVSQYQQRKWNGCHYEDWHYRWTQNVPLRAGDDGLRVNWCEVTVTPAAAGTRLYKNSFITSLDVNKSTVKRIVQAGRTRWKHENEGHNVLTTRGYHIKHNFGHGEQHLATVLFTLNLLAFLLHTFLLLVDTRYKAVRDALGARRTFFSDVRSLLRYQVFADWEALLRFMAIGLEVAAPP